MQRRPADTGRRSHTYWQLLPSLVVILGWSTVCPAQDPAAALEDSLIKVVEQTEAAVVSIARFKPSADERIEAKHKALPPFRNELRRPNLDLTPGEMDMLPNEFGAGSLISPPNSANRFVLTNLHVVRGGPIFPKFSAEDETVLRIRFSDRRSCLAAIIAADPRSDLAVLRLNWDEAGIKATDFPRLNWETANSPRKGQFVILLGNPYLIARDGSASVSWGLVSNLTRQPMTINRNQPFDLEEQANSSMLSRLGAVMQLDAHLNLGTSGGPVLNLKGELIGISTSLAAIEGYEQSVGFALPIDSLTRRIVRTLLAGQEVEYGMLGIKPGEISPEDFLRRNTGLRQRSGAAVMVVNQNSPAHRAGIRVDDMIVGVQGEPVQSVADLMRMVGMHSPDSEIDVTIWRAIHGLETIRIRLGKWPVRDDEGIIETNPRYAPWRGLSVDYPTARQRFIEPPIIDQRFIDQSSDFRRVLVTKVTENTPADAARLTPGNYITHVNNVAVQTPAEFHAAVKAATGTVALKLQESFDTKLQIHPVRTVLVRE